MAPLTDLTIFMDVIIINDKELCEKQKQKNFKYIIILRESSSWKDFKTNPFNDT